MSTNLVGKQPHFDGSNYVEEEDVFEIEGYEPKDMERCGLSIHYVGYEGHTTKMRGELVIK